MPTGSPQTQVLVESFELLNNIDPTEYATLPEASKDGVRLILGCGILDLAKSGKIYSYLLAIFGSSPITKAAIEAL